MDPRSLIGPTLLVFMLIVATLGTIFLFDASEHEPMNPEDAYTMTRSEFKAAIAERMDAHMNRQLIYYGAIAVLICVVPMGRINHLTRGVMLVAIGLVGRFLTGDQAGAFSSLTKMCALGGVLLAVLIIIKLYSKTVDNGKRPAVERWAPRRSDPGRPDDPETLARLDRLRVVATLPPPRTS
ncbi:MAG: hypothetical protein HQ518_33095 [Rhodopirellula sp.]|nr:hypothetical protein [Rhodopirellula sp.]